MLCPNCGAENDDTAKVCGKCGTTLDENLPVAEAEEATEEVAEETAEETTEESDEENDELDEEFLSRFDDIDVEDEPKKKKRKVRQPENEIETEEEEEETGKELTAIRILVAAEALILVLIIVGFCAIGKLQNDASFVAERYMQAYADHDWEKVYDLMERPEGALLQKALFVETMEASDLPVIQNFEVTLDTHFDRKKEKHYDVQYTTNVQETSDIKLKLIKQKEKAMFFFDKWRVSPEAVLVNDYKIHVPRGASVAIDGIALDKDKRIDGEIVGMDTYAVTLFEGKHDLQAAVPWHEIYENLFTVGEGEEYSVSGLIMTEDGKTAVQSKMQTVLKKMYTAAMSEDDFSTIESLFAVDAREACRQTYDAFVAGLRNASYKINTVTFDSFSCQVYDGENYSPTGVRATLNFQYHVGYTSQYVGWWGVYSGYDEQTGDGNASIEATFVYSGDTYRVSSVKIGNLF